MNKFNHVFIYGAYLIMSALFLCCQNQNDYSYENLIKEGDNIVKAFDKNDVMVFAETMKHNYERVRDINNWKKEYISILNVFKTNEIKVVKVIIEPESEDYYCVSNLYYDQQNKLKVIIEDVSYFNSTCTEGILNKKSVYYLNNQSEIHKNVEYTDENQEIVNDTTACLDNYSCDIKRYYNYKDIPIS